MWDKHTHYHCAHSHGGGDGEGAGVFFLIVVGAVIAFVAWIHHQRHVIAKAATEATHVFVDAIVWALEMVALCVAVGVGSVAFVFVAWRVIAHLWQRHRVRAQAPAAELRQTATVHRLHVAPTHAIEPIREAYPVIDAEIVGEPHVIKERAR
jgi:chloramphenicol 3-O-phosphotransferase